MVSRIGFKTKIALVNGIGLLFMSIIAAVVYVSIQVLIKNADWVAHTHKVIEAGNTLEKLMVDMETGQRGFLISGSNEYFEQYNISNRNFTKLIAEIKQLVSDNPVQVGRLGLINDLMKKWERNIITPEINLRREMNNNSVDIFDVNSLIKKGSGKKLMDDIRDEFKAFINVEMALMEKRKKEARKMTAKTVKRVTHTYEVIGKAKDFQKLLLDMETGERGFLISGNEDFLEPYKNGKDKLNTVFIEIKLLVSDNPAQVAQLRKIKLLSDQWIGKAAEPEINMRREINKNSVSLIDIARSIQTGKGKAAIDELRSKLAEFVHEERRLMGKREMVTNDIISLVIAVTVLGTLFAIIMGTTMSVLITRVLFSQIGGEPSTIDDIAEKVAKGNIQFSFMDKDKPTGVYASLKRLVDSLKKIEGQTNRIALGDYSELVAIRSEEDTLSVSLNNMTKILREITAENQKQDWIQNGISQLTQQMLGEQDMTQLTRSIIGFLTEYLDAQVGVFYLMQTDRLVLSSSYAYSKDSNNYKDLEIGEGLVGQAAHERRPIHFSGMPEDHFQIMIDSSMGKSKSTSVIAVPLIVDDNLTGVFALGSAGDFSDLHLEFVSLIGDNIGIGLSATQSHALMNDWLKAVQDQAEELKVQQRDLKVANKKLEEAMLEVEEKAEALAMASKFKSEFLANMSHEIRTPMNAVIGFSELLSSLITDKTQKNYLNSIQIAGKSLLRLINDILDLSKIEVGKLDIQYESVNPHIIFNEVNQIFQMKMSEKELDLIIDVDQTLPSELVLDETRLRQVLFNLMGNAVKFTNTGYIKLSVEKKYKEKNHSKLDLIILVQDSGIGIPENQLQSIFEAFKQQDGQSTREYGGTGLGLAITKRLVEMMGGSIDVRSTTGKGSTFEITLRDVDVSSVETAPVSPEKPFSITDVSFEPAKVLVVDDIDHNRELIKASLSLTGLDILEAANGKQAIEEAEKLPPAVILMDIRMPVMDGYEATRILKSNPKTKDIPIIALTASVSAEAPAKMQQQGFSCYLPKPVNMHDLTKELSLHLKRRDKNEQQAADPTPGTSAVTVNAEEIDNLPELLNAFKMEIMPEYNNFKGTIEIDMVEVFAKKLIVLAETHNFKPLKEYADNLAEYVESFDIDQMTFVLNEFPNIYNEIKKA